MNLTHNLLKDPTLIAKGEDRKRDLFWVLYKDKNYDFFFIMKICGISVMIFRFKSGYYQKFTWFERTYPKTYIPQFSKCSHAFEDLRVDVRREVKRKIDFFLENTSPEKKSRIEKKCERIRNFFLQKGF